jgi:hypothetical protein
MRPCIKTVIRFKFIVLVVASFRGERDWTTRTKILVCQTDRTLQFQISPGNTCLGPSFIETGRHAKPGVLGNRLASPRRFPGISWIHRFVVFQPHGYEANPSDRKCSLDPTHAAYLLCYFNILCLAFPSLPGGSYLIPVNHFTG